MAYEPKKGDSVSCTVCGRKVHLLNNGKGPLVCCGKAMIKSTLPMSESAAAVMSCRAAKSSIGLWEKRLQTADTSAKEELARKMIQIKRKKVQKCRERGLMI